MATKKRKSTKSKSKGKSSSKITIKSLERRIERDLKALGKAISHAFSSSSKKKVENKRSGPAAGKSTLMKVRTSRHPAQTAIRSGLNQRLTDKSAKMRALKHRFHLIRP